MNIFDFCLNRTDPPFIASVMNENRQGLSDPWAMNGALEQGNYVFILKCILGEPSVRKRLEYLRNPIYKFQPFLSYERAMSEFADNLTKSHLVSVVFPQQVIGLYKNEMYAKCSQDQSILELCRKVDNIYIRAICNFVEHAIGKSALNFSKEERKEIVIRTRDLVMDLLEELQKPDYIIPSPCWISHCTDKIMHPESEWKQICIDFLTKERDTLLTIAQEIDTH